MYEKLDENRPNVRLFTHYEHLHYPVKKTPLIGIEPTKGETNETMKHTLGVMGNVYIVTGKLSS